VHVDDMYVSICAGIRTNFCEGRGEKRIRALFCIMYSYSVALSTVALAACQILAPFGHLTRHQLGYSISADSTSRFQDPRSKVQ
jgi:hypothetical protein